MRRLRRAAWVAAGALLLAGCNDPAKPRDLVLVTLDTTRVDALGIYGGASAHTPHLDAAAQEWVVYTRAMTTQPCTGPAHASMLTGLYPPQHGLRDFLNQALPERVETLAEVLGSRGWETAAFVSTYVLDRRYGLDQGFALYAQPESDGGTRRVERDGARTMDEVERWLRHRDSSRPFFLWVHLFDSHSPYAPPRRLWPKQLANFHPGSLPWLRALYYREVTYADEQVGRLLEALQHQPGWEEMAILVVADHGEALGRHGRPIMTHSPWLSEVTVHVPLLLRVPGRLEPGVVHRPVSVVDVFPTLLAAAGQPIPTEIAGRSLLTDPDEPARPVYSETFYEFFPERASEGRELVSVRLDDWKLLVSPGREELFDLGTDPEELRDVSREHPEQVQRMRAALATLRADWPEISEAAPLDLPEEERRSHEERLRALGYLE